MLRRKSRRLIEKRLRNYPAVAIVGPRQCGKTTLARSFKGEYFDLEQDSERLRLDLEWERLASGNRLVILDEAQSWPTIFGRLRGTIDSDRRRMGRFLLLSSVSPSLMINVSESLAGRLSLIELTPFLMSELETQASKDRHWLCGGFPDGGVLRPGQYRQWQRDYLALLAQRDLPTWGFPAKPRTTDRLLLMLAAVHGQTWNASQIGKSLGLSYQTINTYLDHLVGAFLLRRLPPFKANVRKRLVKSPKVFLRDSGLLHALLNVSDARTLITQPWVGASWEGYVIEQAIGALSSLGRNFNAYSFRTSDQYELDLVLDFGGEIWAVEIKLTTAPSHSHLTRLVQVADMIDASSRFLISKTKKVTSNGKTTSCNLEHFIKCITTNRTIG